MLSLQSQFRTIEQVRRLFDALLREYPFMTKYIHPNSNIVHSLYFEAGIMKLESCQALITNKRQAVQALLYASLSFPIVCLFSF
jgi:hypothetical protein